VADVYSLSVRADTSDIRRGRQDLDRFGNQAGRTRGTVAKLGKSLAAFAATSAVAVAGMSALVVSTANAAREVQNLARLSGATPQEFQKAAYGAKRFGVEQEKLSDILKDTNDRIGEFIQTGGGPMADFFENIAPKVGVTAEQFAKLSGPDALQLYVKSLKDAGVSQKDMTFYMEAIASDATALLPLLRDNGKEMKILGDEAERTGNVFSDLEFEQLEDVKRGLDELTGAATGMKNEVVMAALPAINDLIDLLSDESTMKSAQALGTAVVTAMNKAAQAIDGTIKITKFLAEELAAMTAGAAADDIVRLEDELGTLYSMLDNPTERLRFFGKDGAVVYYNKDEIWDMIAEMENKIVNFRNNIGKGGKPAPLLDLVDPPTLPDAGNPPGGTGGAGAAADSAAAIKLELEFLRTQNALIEAGVAASEAEIIVREKKTQLQLQSKGLTAAEADKYIALGNAIDDATEAEAERASALESIRAQLNPAQAEFTRYADQLDMIDSFNISMGEKEALREESFRQHQERMNAIASEGQGAKLLEQEQADTLSSSASFFGNLAAIAQKGGEDQFEAYKALASAQAAISATMAIVSTLGDPTVPSFLKIPLAVSIGALAAAQVAQIQAQTYDGARAMGGSVTGGNSYMVGENGPEVVTMGGSGVVTPSSVGGGGTNIVINDQTTTSTGHDVQTQETTGPEGQRQMQVTIRDTVRRQVMQGEFDRQLGSKFDLKSKGRRV